MLAPSRASALLPAEATPPAAAVSARSRDLVMGPPRVAAVVGTYPEALYLLLAPLPGGRPHVLPVLRPGALRLPLGLLVPDAAGRSWPSAREALVGDGRVQLGDWTLRVVREFAPRSVRPRAQSSAWTPCLADAVHRLTTDLPSLIGRGEGLTPAGDDLVCGAVLMLVALGHRDAVGALRSVLEPLLARTTALSADLIDAAHDGCAVPDVALLVERVAAGIGDGDAGLVAAVRSIGHTSGSALLDGIDLIARAAKVRSPWTLAPDHNHDRDRKHTRDHIPVPC